MKESKKKLNRSDITRLGYRSLINQAGFNYERMQNIGFTATIGPALEKIYIPIKKRRSKYVGSYSAFLLFL